MHSESYGLQRSAGVRKSLSIWIRLRANSRRTDQFGRRPNTNSNFTFDAMDAKRRQIFSVSMHHVPRVDSATTLQSFALIWTFLTKNSIRRTANLKNGMNGNENGKACCRDTSRRGKRWQT